MVIFDLARSLDAEQRQALRELAAIIKRLKAIPTDDLDGLALEAARGLRILDELILDVETRVRARETREGSIN